MTLPYDKARTEAEAALQRAELALTSEIASYPTPIAGCDAQFNHLLAERRRLAKARAALRAPAFVPTPRSPTPNSGIESR